MAVSAGLFLLGAGVSAGVGNYVANERENKATEERNKMLASIPKPEAPDAASGVKAATDARERQRKKATAAAANDFIYTGPRGLTSGGLGSAGAGFKTSLGG